MRRWLKAAFEHAGFGWITSHTLRKTCASLMDGAGLSARAAADQLGHARPSIAADVCFGRQAADTGAAQVLEPLGF
jgi:integrase